MKQQHFNSKFSLKVELEICHLYIQGTYNSSKILAKKFGCTFGTILNILKRHKIPIRKNSESQIGLRIGSKHHGYKGGNISPNGYKRIYVDRRLKLEHRHIIEQSIGRKLLLSEIVHHKNHDKLDNRIENLEIMSRAEHGKLHGPELVKNLH